MSFILFGINRLGSYFNITHIPYINTFFLLIMTFIIIFPYIIGKSYKINYSILRLNLTKYETIVISIALILTLHYQNTVFALFILILIIIQGYSKK